MSDGTLGLAPLGLEPLGGFPAEFANASTDPYASLFEDPEQEWIYLVEIERLPAGAG